MLKNTNNNRYPLYNYVKNQTLQWNVPEYILKNIIDAMI